MRELTNYELTALAEIFRDDISKASKLPQTEEIFPREKREHLREKLLEKILNTELWELY